MRRWIQKLLPTALCAGLALTLAGCGETAVTPSAPDAPSAEAPLLIRLYGNLDEPYVPFLDALAAAFPEAALQYEFQWDIPGTHEAERRILHGDGPDLAVVRGAALESLTQKNLLLDLTGTNFSTRYHVSTMTQLNNQGQVLGLPLPNDLYCLHCNMDILRANGIETPPRSVPELLEVCRALTENGQSALFADEQLYQMLLRANYLCTPAGYDWLQSFNAGEATMAGTPAADAWADFAALAAVSGCTPKDASAMPAARTEMMMSGRYAFRVATLSNLKFVWEAVPDLDVVALPLLGESEEDQWVFYADQRNMRYFVANGALAQPENAAKQELVLRMLDWISTQEAQQLLASCGSSAISYVNDVELEQGNIMEYLSPVIQAGRLTSSEVLGRGVFDLLPKYVAQILGNEMNAAQVVEACDATNRAFVPAQEETAGLDEVIGTATAPIYWRKPAAVTVGSPMTQLAAEAMAEAFPQADFAFAMAKNAAGTIYPGAITMEDVRYCANGEGDRELLLVQATGSQIADLIESGVGSPTQPGFTVPYGVAGKGRLLHPVGLTYQADITREAGDKVTEITLTGGGALKPDQTYTIIVSGLLVDGVTKPNLEGCETTATGKYLRDVLEDYIRAHGEISPPELGFEISGAIPIYTTP